MKTRQADNAIKVDDIRTKKIQKWNVLNILVAYLKKDLNLTLSFKTYMLYI